MFHSAFYCLKLHLGCVPSLSRVVFPSAPKVETTTSKPEARKKSVTEKADTSTVTSGEFTLSQSSTMRNRLSKLGHK